MAEFSLKSHIITLIHRSLAGEFAGAFLATVQAERIDKLADDILDKVAEAAKNAKLPEEYQWGADALEAFEFGKKCAAEAVLQNENTWLTQNKEDAINDPTHYVHTEDCEMSCIDASFNCTCGAKPSNWLIASVSITPAAQQGED